MFAGIQNARVINDYTTLSDLRGKGNVEIPNFPRHVSELMLLDGMYQILSLYVYSLRNVVNRGSSAGTPGGIRG